MINFYRGIFYISTSRGTRRCPGFFAHGACNAQEDLGENLGLLFGGPILRKWENDVSFHWMAQSQIWLNEVFTPHPVPPWWVPSAPLMVHKKNSG